MMRIKIISFLIGLLFVLSCEESDLPTDNEYSDIYTETVPKYFPYHLNQKYQFNIDTMNSDDGLFYSKGTREVEFVNDQKVGEYSYYTCTQLHKYISQNLMLNTNFRFSNLSILLLTDTSRVSEVLPDSLAGNVSITVDNEVNLLQFPLNVGERWAVVKAYVDFQTFKFNTVDVEAEVIEKESISIENIGNSIEATKVNYKLDINMPDISNPLFSETVSYYADLWFAEDIGVVKMEGCSFMLNLITGHPMIFGDLELVSRQILTKIE